MLPSAKFTFDMCAGAHKDAKSTKGRLLHARVTVGHEVNSERRELPELTRGAVD